MSNSQGLYIHFPFCAAKCAYCDFVSAPARTTDEIGRYWDVLFQELARRVSGPVSSVYFGGGTPSLAAPERIGAVLAAVGQRAELAADAEITLEVNPATADLDKLSRFRGAGVNRLSIGIQTTNAAGLKLLGRIHTTDQSRQLLADARRAGFENISADLIYGFPGQKTSDFMEDLAAVTTWEIEHLSLYALSVEAGTPLAERIRLGELPEPDEDEAADMYGLAGEYLLKTGFLQYELSNFARPGKVCRHNLGYWTGVDYLGLGVAAHSYQNGERKWNTPEIAAYLEGWEQGGGRGSGSEKLNENRKIAELLIIGLRLTAGISKSDFARRFGADWLLPFQPALAQQVEAGLLEDLADGLKLTPRGMLLSNVVFRALV